MNGLICPPALGVNGPGRIWRRPAVERWRGRYLPHVVAAAVALVALPIFGWWRFLYFGLAVLRFVFGHYSYQHLSSYLWRH